MEKFDSENLYREILQRENFDREEKGVPFSLNKKKMNKNTITVKNNKKSGGMNMKKARKIIIFTVIIFIGITVRNICNF